MPTVDISAPRRAAPAQPHKAACSMGLHVERQAEFSERLREDHSKIYAYIFSLVRDFDDADDLFQQTGLALWKKFDQFDPARSFAAWACGVARLEVSNFLRARGRHRIYFSDELNLLLVDAQDEAEARGAEERREALARCMSKLRKRDLQLLEACYDESKRIPEIARSRGRSTQSVHNSLRRIRQSLFACVGRSLAREGLA